MIDFRNNDFTTKGDNITITGKDGTTTTMPRDKYQKYVNTTWGASLFNMALIGFLGGVLVAERDRRRNLLPPTKRRKQGKKKASWRVSLFGRTIVSKKSGRSVNIFRGGTLL
jgi:hypothetical protein